LHSKSSDSAAPKESEAKTGYPRRFFRMAHHSFAKTLADLNTSTTRRTEASASAAKIRPPRQALLGGRSSILVRMATIPLRVGIVGHGFVRFSAVSGKSDNDHIIGVAGCELLKTILDCGNCRLLIREQRRLAAQCVSKKSVQHLGVAACTAQSIHSRRSVPVNAYE
jgi:hypothetical protein